MEQQNLQEEAQPGASAPQAEGETQVRDISPDERAKNHYADVISGLLEDAVKNKTQSALSNVMTFNLAWLVVEYGPNAASHVLERLGSHIGYFVDRNRAAREAEEAREAGNHPH